MSGLFGGGPKVDQKAPVAADLRVSTSAYGAPIPIVYGATRVAVNCIWYGDFQAIPQTTSVGGGKGGGGGNVVSGYDYRCAIAMALCEGPISKIGKLWAGSNSYVDNASTGNVTISQIVNVDVSNGPQIITVDQAANLVASPEPVVQVWFSSVGGIAAFGSYQTLTPTIEYTRSGGVFTFTNAFVSTTGSYTGQVKITYTYSPVSSLTSLAQLGLTLFNGTLAQNAWSYLTSAHAGQDLAYRGVAYLANASYDMGNSAQMPNLNAEVYSNFHYGGTVYGALPPDIMLDLLTNPVYGGFFDYAKLGDLSDYRSYCIANGFFLSCAYTQQKPLNQMLQDLADITNSNFVFGDKRLRVVPYADQQVVGNGVTWNPNLAAVYNLLDDDLLPASSEQGPIVLARKSPEDRYNALNVVYCSRARNYQSSIQTAKDESLINAYGLKQAPDLDVKDKVADDSIAKTISQLALQRHVAVNNTYQFTLPFRYFLLEPMDLITVTDATLGLNSALVRITEISETGSGELSVTAEEVPVGAASSVLYPQSVGSGYTTNYNALPSSIQAPMFFEMPEDLAGATGITVGIATAGQLNDPLYGGCRAWLSYDGTTYEDVGKVFGIARYGTLTGAIGSGGSSLGVQLAGNGAALASATTTAANQGANLSVLMSGASQEFLAFEAVSGTNPYTCSTLHRGLHYSNALAWGSGAPFARIDEKILTTPPIQVSQIGTTVYFKFTAFNLFGSGEQSLASVTAYPYTVTGASIKYPPLPPVSPTSAFEPTGIRLSWTPPAWPDIAKYEVRQGASWAAGVNLTGTGTNNPPTQIQGSNYFWAVQVTAVYTLWIASVDVFGNYSTPVQFTASISAPTAVTGLTAQTVDNNILFFWGAPASSLPIANYIVQKGANWDSNPASTQIIGVNGPSTFFTYFEQTAGNFKYWIAAKDLAGNVSTPSSVQVTVAAPPDYVLRADLFSSFAGTTSLTYVENGALIGPTHNAWLSWASHFQQNYYIQNLADATTWGTNLCAISGPNVVSPSGFTDGYTITTTSAGNDFTIMNSAGIDMHSTQVTLSTYLKLGSKNSPIVIWMRDGADNNIVYATFTLSGGGSYGGLGGGGSGLSASISSAGNGWYLCSITGTFPAGATVGVHLYIDPSNNAAGAGETYYTYGTQFCYGAARLYYWDTPQEQIDVGYPIYIEPSNTGGSYEETIDYGSVLPATTITVTATTSAVTGTVTLTPQIYYKVNSGDSWTAAPAGAWSVLAPSFRYLLIHIDLTCGDAVSIVKVTSLETKLNVKQRRDGGAASYTAGETHTAVNSTTGQGHLVLFNYPFISAYAPVVQALPATNATNLPWTAVVDYNAVANPLGFGVLIYDRTGAQRNCAFTWSASGY
jgi:hypothetical protein